MKIPHGSFSHTPFNDTEVEIGKWTTIAANCIFHGPDNHGSIINRKWVTNNLDASGHSKGKIIIGNDVWIGDGVRILSGSKIDDGTIIGAGSVVAGHILPYRVAVGNPCITHKMRFTHAQVEALLAIQWWNWDPVMIAERRADFDNIDEFIKKYNVEIHKNDSH